MAINLEMTLKRKILLIILITLFILFAFTLFPFLYLEKYYPQKENRSLFKSAERFKSLLKKKDGKGIYALFNQTFQKEISEERFLTAFNQWLKGKKVKKVETKFINVTGFTGQVSTWLWGDEKDYQYLFSSWIKTKKGWYLLWLSPILNQDFEYGVGELKERRELLRLATEKALGADGFEEIFPEFDLPHSLVFLKKGRLEERVKSSRPVLWLTLEEIKEKAKYLSLPFYFDFGAIRIIDNLATVYLDIIPIKGEGNQNFRHTRGLQFQFRRKEDGSWEFVGYGSRW
ncbi:MAG: hypothetical protein ABIK81_00540 [candidate division WOR-3 bacterium]